MTAITGPPPRCRPHVLRLGRADGRTISTPAQPTSVAPRRPCAHTVTSAAPDPEFLAGHRLGTNSAIDPHPVHNAAARTRWTRSGAEEGGDRRPPGLGV